MAAPSKAALAWAVREVSGRLVAVTDLHEGRGPWLVTVTRRGSEFRAVLRVADEWGKETSYVRIEASALELAERSALAAPRLISLDPDGSEAGQVASLQTVLPGNTLHRDPTARDQLRAVGAYLATMHRISARPEDHLPERLQHFDVYRRSERATVTPRSRIVAGLLQDAIAELARHPRPTAPVGLVHGDAWLGNIMSTGSKVVGLIDWGCAGVGHPGIDLGHLRLSAVFEHGMPAPDEVLIGWQQEAGYPAEAAAYWDLTAALTTPAGMGSLTQVRDAFVADALERLGSPLKSPG